MANFENTFSTQRRTLERFLKTTMLDIIAIEGVNHFEESFDNQGFTNMGLTKWKPRKTIDNRGRDLTRYRTNRVGRRGNLNSYGRKNVGRAILTGHNSGGNKLRNSIYARKISGGVRIGTNKPYAKRHNEGLDGMPKRQFIGRSKTLDRKIIAKADKTIMKIFK